jgi:hypothetical protein
MIYELADRILRRRANRRRIGWTDYSSDSHDRRMAQAQAWRIIQRLNHGRRISLHQAMQE